MRGRFRFREGFLELGAIRGIRVRAHGALLLLLLVLPFFGLAFFALSVVVLVLAHELGHAFLGRRYFLHVERVDLRVRGGECWMLGLDHLTPRARAVIAWGGVLGQLVLLLPALVWVIWFPTPEGWLGAPVTQMLLAFVPFNAVQIVFNLLPIPRLDGAEAWKVVPILIRRARSRRQRPQRSSAAERGRRRGLVVVLDDDEPPTVH